MTTLCLTSTLPMWFNNQKTIKTHQIYIIISIQYVHTLTHRLSCKLFSITWNYSISTASSLFYCIVTYTSNPAWRERGTERNRWKRKKERRREEYRRKEERVQRVKYHNTGCCIESNLGKDVVAVVTWDHCRLPDLDPLTSRHPDRLHAPAKKPTATQITTSDMATTWRQIGFF